MCPGPTSSSSASVQALFVPLFTGSQVFEAFRGENVCRIARGCLSSIGYILTVELYKEASWIINNPVS